jgi:hypothetical protein
MLERAVFVQCLAVTIAIYALRTDVFRRVSLDTGEGDGEAHFTVAAWPAEIAFTARVSSQSLSLSSRHFSS